MIQPAKEKSYPVIPQQYDSKDMLALIRYGQMHQVGVFRHRVNDFPICCTKAIIQTDRGTELGEVVTKMHVGTQQGCGSCAQMISTEQIEEYISNSPGYRISCHGRILRLASYQDLEDNRHIDEAMEEKLATCKRYIRKMNLNMKLVSGEHLFGGERIVFYFTAEQRIDFRELVRMLAREYHTRIEMRQVGVRDEARLVADFETCGRQCCCQSFLKGLQPVTMKMAKQQKATVDPSKVSGRCGRLKCCLRYEDQTYDQMTKSLPRKGVRVKIEDGTGTVVDTQVITQLVKIALDSGRMVALGVEDIEEFNVPSKPPPPRPERRPRPEPPEPKDRPKRLLRDETVEAPDTPAPQPASGQSEESPSSERPDQGGGQRQQRPSGRRRRRRRRRPPGSGGGGDGGNKPA